MSILPLRSKYFLYYLRVTDAYAVVLSRCRLLQRVKKCCTPSCGEKTGLLSNYLISIPGLGHNGLTHPVGSKTVTTESERPFELSKYSRGVTRSHVLCSKQACLGQEKEGPILRRIKHETFWMEKNIVLQYILCSVYRFELFLLQNRSSCWVLIRHVLDWEHVLKIGVADRQIQYVFIVLTCCNQG